MKSARRHNLRRGADTSSFLADHQVIDVLARVDALVYSFTFSDEPGADPEPLLRAATELTGGRMVREKNPKKLAEAFGLALAEVRARYLLSYIPAADTRPVWRKLEVRVKGEDHVRARRGYAR